MRRKKMSKRKSKKLFTRTAIKTNGRNTIGGSNMRGGIRL